jgi:hypothetical protein
LAGRFSTKTIAPFLMHEQDASISGSSDGQPWTKVLDEMMYRLLPSGHVSFDCPPRIVPRFPRNSICVRGELIALGSFEVV